MNTSLAPNLSQPRNAQRGGDSVLASGGAGPACGEFLRIELGSGRAVETSGRLQRLAEAPAEGWAFYCNDFELSDPRPWIVPESVKFSHQAGAKLGASEVTFDWHEPERPAFAAVLAEILDQMALGSLRKAVPVVTAKARWQPEAQATLASRCFQPRGDVGSHAYAYELAGRGAAGLTPEVLFRVEHGVLRTMALAGTVPTGQERELETNEKLLREHETVVSSLVERLTPLGDLHREARRLMPLNSLTHLCTKLSVVLDDPKWQDRVSDLIELLHPTPALGVAPRTADTLEQLRGWRARLGVPAYFGAPLGVKWPGGMLMLVAIRGVFWEEGTAYLPSGCGVVTGSSLASEWEELCLKRQWVRRTLAC